MLLVALVAAVVGVAGACGGRSDDQGVEVVLQAQPTPQAPEIGGGDIDRSIEAMRSRADAFGVAGADIRSQGNDQIVVALPRAEDPEQVVTDLIRPAQMFFFDYEGNLAGPEGDTLEATIRLAQSMEPAGDRGSRTFWLLDDDGEYLAGPAVSAVALRDEFPQGLPGGSQLEIVPAGWFIASEQRGLSTRPDAPTQIVYHLLQDAPALFGRHVTEARSTSDVADTEAQPIVTMDFTGTGREAFQNITRDLATRGQLNGANQRFAIVLDGEIISNPTVDFQDFPTGIDGRNGAQIQGNFTRDEADRVADQLNSGAIPIKLVVVECRPSQACADLGP